MIFLDSGALIAFYYRRDPFHQAAVKGFEKLETTGESAFTTSLCIAEFANVLAFETKEFGQAARAVLEVLRWEMEVVRPSLAEERRALALMETYAGRRVSYTDCLSFVAMDARESRVAFTFDAEHFVKLRKVKPWIPIPRLHP